MGTLRGQGSALIGRNVLARLAANDKGHEIAAWVPREWPENWVPEQLGGGVRRVAPGLVPKFITENLSIPGALRRWRADALFSLGDTSLPRSPVPHLLLVQQAFLAYDTGDWGFSIDAALRAKLALMSQYFKAGLHAVKALTVQTRDMQTRLSRRWGIPPERIHVVPSAIDGVWDDLDLAAGVTPTPSVPPYVCYVAGPGPHKNHAVLADVMSGLRSREPALRCKLTVTADSVPALVKRARERGILSSFAFLGTIGRHELPGLLAGAVAAIIPSKLESFGLSYYEAIAAGCPVVAADRPFSREALGDVGLYAPADEPEAFAAHVAALLDSPSARATLADRCRARWRATRWTWHEVAAAYVRILEGVVQ